MSQHQHQHQHQTVTGSLWSGLGNLTLNSTTQPPSQVIVLKWFAAYDDEDVVDIVNVDDGEDGAGEH